MTVLGHKSLENTVELLRAFMMLVSYSTLQENLQ